MSREENWEEMRKSIWTMVVLVVLLIGLLIGMPARAQQDVPLATNTALDAVIQPAATQALIVAAAPVALDTTPVEQPPVSDNTIFVVGFLVLTGLMGLREFISSRQIGALVTTINTALNNKQVLDEATRTYMQSSLQVQEFIKIAVGLAGILGSSIPGEDLADQLHDFGEKVVSGDAGGVG